MVKWFAFFIIIINACMINAYGFLVSSYSSHQKIDYQAPVRILVTGSGDDLGTLFLNVARGKILKYIEQNPNEQIVLISTKEPKFDNKALLESFGLTYLYENKSKFKGETLIEELVKFKKISSLDIFSHSSAQYGIHLDGKAHRLTTNTKNLSLLKTHFMENAYAFLHGCNAGFYLAPFLSNVWEIPVAGAMTATNFQKLHNDGNFYLSEEGMYPSADWAPTNDKSFNESFSCKKAGTCQRLKPDNNPYTGFWGEYAEGGLPFYKFFCVKNSTETCNKVMAKSLLSFIGKINLKPNATFEEYQKSLFDFLCPVSARKDLRGECEKNLENALLTGDYSYNPFTKKQVECNFKSCAAEIKCKKFFIVGVNRPGTCELENTFQGQSTTLVREYKAYLDGFKYLND